MWSILGSRELIAVLMSATLENYSVVGDLRGDDWKRSCGKKQ